MRLALATLGLFALAGCQTAPLSGPVDVLRYHADALGRGAVEVQPQSGASEVSVDYRAYADAVRAELERVGYPAATAGQASPYLATVAFRRTPRGFVERGSPVSVGIGGGTSSGGWRGGSGIGGGVSFPIGGSRTSEIVATELSVQLRTRGATGSVVWEGRAMTEADVRAADAAPEAAAAKLARALFTGFPGESGRTITVR